MSYDKKITLVITLPDGRDDLGGGVGDQDDSAGRHVLLHGPPEGVLGVLGQLVHLGQHHDLAEKVKCEIFVSS